MSELELPIKVEHRDIPLEVTRNHVILQQMGPVDKGIIIPGEEWKKQPIQHGMIVALGPHCEHIRVVAEQKSPGVDVLTPVCFEKGQHVLYKRAAATPFKLGDEFILIFDSEIIAIVKEV